MQFSAQTLADQLGGTVEGNTNVTVKSAARIEHGKEGNLCFLANPKYEKYLYTTKASIVLINKDFNLSGTTSATLIRVNNAYESIAAALAIFESAKALNRKGRQWPSRVSWRSKKGKNCFIGAFSNISKGAKLGNNVKIFPHVYLGENVVIGDNTILYSGVKVYPDCVIGANCIIHSGCVIGSDGFGFAPEADGTYKKIPQTGNVIIESDVEIGANTVVDRATMGSTVVRKGVKLDNLIQIAHNVEIGKNTVIASQTGIAGSTKVGEGCMFAGQVGLAGHIQIGDGVKIGAQSGVSNNVKDNETIFGYPAMDAGRYRRCIAVFRNLPELRNEVSDLTKASKQTKSDKENN